jgi:hypothetical protein
MADEKEAAAHKERCRLWYEANKERERESSRERSKRRYAENKDRILASQKLYRAANKDHRREIEKRYRAANKDRRRESVRNAQLKHKYGITREEHAALFSAQGFKCAACRSGDPGGRSGWHTDHCHVSGVVRGILCRGCNTSLGQMKEDARAIRALADYIEAHS